MDSESGSDSTSADTPSAAQSRGSLHELADAQRDIAWGAGRDDDDDATALPAVVRVFSGDIGPKGDIVAGFRRRRAGRQTELVPRGTVVDGGGRLIFLTVALIVGVAVAIIILLMWAVS